MTYVRKERQLKEEFIGIVGEEYKTRRERQRDYHCIRYGNRKEAGQIMKYVKKVLVAELGKRQSEINLPLIDRTKRITKGLPQY